MVTQDEREELISNISALQRDMARHFAHDRTMPLLASSLTMQQFKILIILTTQDDLAGQELAERLGVKLGTVTGIVDRLVAQDLVRRTEDLHDRRIRRVSLTDEGLDLMEEITDNGLSQFRKILGELDTDELRQTLRVTQVLRDAAIRLNDS